MKRLLTALTIGATLLLNTACETTDTVKDILNTNLTDAEIVEGLKEALAVGTDTSTGILSLQDGYFADAAVKILLPDEMETTLANFKAKSFNVPALGTVTGQMLFDGVPALGINGLSQKQDDLILGLNRAAEHAATTAGPIFITAITDITIADGYNILFGGDDFAATNYLQSTTSNALVTAYDPIVENALQSVKIGNTSVADSYENFVQSYNDILNTNIPLLGSISSLISLNPVTATDLSVHGTQKALDGLFLKISEEESDIRNNPGARINDILTKVFGQLD